MTGRVPEPAELAEDLARIEAAIERASQVSRSSFDALNRRIEERYVTKEMHVGDRRLMDQRFEAQGEKIAKVEERHTWLARTSLTALFLPILVLIIGALLLTVGAR